MTIDITVSNSAQTYIKQMVEQKQGLGFRVSIKKTGCSGYAYAPSIVEQIDSADQLIDISGLKIFIDSKWIALLQGVQVDYVEENKSGLKQKRLVFINPNEANRCGCGESFHLESNRVL
jgi:iron-sulfur cluster assembly protein